MSEQEPDAVMGDPGRCVPDDCPCAEGACTLSRYTRVAKAASGDPGPLAETERAVAGRLAGQSLDLPAMAAMHNMHRAAGAIRHRLERAVLAEHDLTWTGWVVLWVVWISGEMETHQVAVEAGVSKATLTGVARTLRSRGLLWRRTHPGDARRALLRLTPAGDRLMTTLLPRFNEEEAVVAGALDRDEMLALARSLRKVALRIEDAAA